jgi:hypothetical protein
VPTIPGAPSTAWPVWRKSIAAVSSSSAISASVAADSYLVELSAAVRTEFLAGSSPDAPTRPALVQVKSNLGCLAPSLGYLIDDTGAFSWTGPSSAHPGGSHDDRPIGAGLPKRKLAAEWLRQNLLEGERSQYNIETAAQRDGICITTLRRAKFDLGVVSTKESVSGAWFWALPEDEAANTDAVVP